MLRLMSFDFRELPQWVFDLDDARPVAMPAKPPSYLRGHRKELEARFERGGAGALSDQDLLELLLFRALPRADVKPIACDLLERFGDYNHAVSAPIQRLMEVSGLDEQAARELKLIEAAAHRLARGRVLERPVISGWDAVLEYCQTTMAHQQTEQFRVLFLDRKNLLIADEDVARGTVDHVPVYPREIVKRALELNACALILVHNHPSGDPTPSQEDIQMTGQIKSASESLGLQLHDHIVIGKSCEVSFRAQGLL